VTNHLHHTREPRVSTSCAVGRYNMPPPPLTFWPWKWCPSHVWRGIPLCQF